MMDWEHRYRVGDTPWDKGQAAPPLLELLERKGPGVFGAGPVWVPGCGVGHDVRLLAGHGLPVVGVDIAPSAVESAVSHEPAGDESYALGDFLDLAWISERRVSGVWEHTCFCAIAPDRRGDYARAAAQVVEPGGVLAGVFFLTPYDPGEEAAGPPHAAATGEIVACVAPWFELEEAWVPSLAYPGREGREWLALFRRRPNPQVAGPGESR